MSQTTSPGGSGHRDDAPISQDAASGPQGPAGPGPEGPRRPRAASLVAGSILCLVALVLLVSGAWAMWKVVADRDADGFISFGTAEFRTGQHAIVGDLQGAGPHWFYGPDVLGEARVRATSQGDQPLFVGIARTDDVFGYLQGAGYATVYSFEVTADTTHPGGAPSGPPSEESIWAASTQGTGEQTLRWTPRPGDWSVVLMNTDAGADVHVRGDASATLPVLPWLAGGALLVGGIFALLGVWVLVRAPRR